MKTMVDEPPVGGDALAFLRSIDRVLGSSSSMADAGEPILRSASEHLGADAARLWLADPGANPLRVASGWAARDSFDDQDPDLTSLGFAAQVLETGSTRWEEEGGARWLGVPVRGASSVLGVIELRGGALQQADPDLLEALEIAANHIGQFAARIDAEERAVLTQAALRPKDDQVPAITYFDALDGVSTTLYISPQTEALIGYSQQEWLEDPDLWEKLLHPDDHDWVLTENDRTQKTGDPFHAEYRLVTKDGQVRWLSDDAELVEEDGRPLFWRGVMMDITDRKRAEAALGDAEAKYRTLVEQIPAITYMEALEGRRMLYISPQIEAILGFTPEERKADRNLWVRQIHPDDRRRVLAADARATDTGEPFRMDYRIQAKDGRLVWVRDESTLVRDEQGKPLHWQGVVVDITDRKRAEQEHALLAERVVAAQEEERSRIAMDIHDDPIQKMTAVDLRIQMIQRSVTDPAILEQLGDLQDTVRGSIERLRNFLFELEPPSLDEEGLAAAIGEYLQQAQAGAPYRFEIENRLSAEPPQTVRTIAYRVAQEALANVGKHAQASRVVVLLRSRDDGVLVRIADDGVGFAAAEHRPSVSHLGLTAMRERVELAGGWLHIDSSPGRGAVVEFWVPNPRT